MDCKYKDWITSSIIFPLKSSIFELATQFVFLKNTVLIKKLHYENLFQSKSVDIQWIGKISSIIFDVLLLIT